MKSKFPFEHVVKYDTKEVWVKCNNRTTSLGISSLVNKYYPGYSGHIANEEFLNTLKNQLAN